MVTKKNEPATPPVVTCNWCDHRTDEVEGHVVTPEGAIERCPFVNIAFVKGFG